MPNRRTQHPAPILKHQDSSDSSSGSDTNSDDCPLPFASCAAASSFHTTRVRFPPPSQLAHAELTYPPCAYDRAPIVVTPNTCALPRRGARFYPCPMASFDSDSSDDNGAAAPVRCARSRTRRNVTPPTMSSSSSTHCAAQDALAAASIAVPPTMAPGSALAFLPHPPVQQQQQQQACPQEKKKRRSQTPAAPRRRCAAAAARISCSFDSAEADSCLGGF